LILEHLARQAIAERATQLGFAQIGWTRADDAPGYERFCEWLDRGYAGTMSYLEGRREAYRHPQSILVGCRTLILLAMPYRPHPRTRQKKQSVHGAAPATARGTIAAYAVGRRDYHDLIHDRLKELLAMMNGMFPEARSRGVVDTAPLLERDFARMAGIGWIGKNTLLLNRKLGSSFFLAAILTEASLGSDEPFGLDHCGTCTACMDACPTDAFVEPHVMDATRCISYWTIEHRGVVPEAMRPRMGDWLFGCDVCQMVCPWNRKVDAVIDSELQPHAWEEKTDCLFWLTLDEATFRRRFRATPFWRTRLSGMQRNAMTVAANIDCQAAIEPIQRFLVSEDPMLRETAEWSLRQLQGSMDRELDVRKNSL
jgi:epoxyqueuosine reductase